MSLRDDHADHLAAFAEDARGQVAREVEAEGFGTLRRLAIHEDERGVFADVEVDLHGEVVARWGSATYTRRSLVISREDGPLDDASFAADLLATVVIEDLHTCGRRPS